MYLRVVRLKKKKAAEKRGGGIPTFNENQSEKQRRSYAPRMTIVLRVWADQIACQVKLTYVRFETVDTFLR